MGTFRPTNCEGKSLILNGHIDVVPEGPHDMWSSPPFEPRINGEWMYGRGSGDMKAGLASNIFALEALKRIKYHPTAEIYLQSVVEEECTGNGALACLARGYKARAAIIPEPMGDRLLRAQIGVIWFQVTVKGIPTHVAYADTGSNAIEASFGLIQGLKTLEKKWNKEKINYVHYKNHHHPIHLNIGKIIGGDWASSVPSWCVFDVRVAIYPGDSLNERKAEIEECLYGAANQNSFLKNAPPQIKYNGFLAEGYILTGDENSTPILRNSHKFVNGSELEELSSTGTTDARFFGLYAGIPALVYGPSAESIHGFDERVNLESLRKNTQTIALYIANWCGIEKI